MMIEKIPQMQPKKKLSGYRIFWRIFVLRLILDIIWIVVSHKMPTLEAKVPNSQSEID